MNEYHENSGLTEYEWKLEQIIDKIRNEKSTLLAIKILEREIKQLNEETRKDSKKKCIATIHYLNHYCKRVCFGCEQYK